ncbi:alpha/beta hydrolase [Luteolibacter sp. GHJ8]|uniref:Alpha/beta hydrolase n=1 Tax=Luteolibacter rhizosphaerae TaxID=2989719 RepID=A0ABT3FZC4_9BACT|nr:alpha/beta hydrolase [Luteolibacter rhizosphaerae]MCW1912938.1 alpha/beta hydrolase [Luteolibacter rhizosphaerae]
MVERPDGSQLRIYCYGDPDGEPLVATHGWGLSSEAWNYLKREIPHGCRLIVWDLPGLGESKGPVTGDYSLAKMAMDLDAVMAFAGKPCTLVGHSIGGMIIQTYMQTFPEKLRVRVRGAILVHTTPVDPVKTTSGSSYLLPLEGPLLAPLMRITIALSPLVRVLNWLSYANGSTHLTTKFSSFAGHESWQQVDFAARFTPRASPAVLAAGMLEMMRYDALTALPTVKVPVAVIAGNRDSTTLPEASGLIYGSIEGAVLHTLTPAKHLGYIERHASFHQLLREFWRDRRMEIG